MEKVDVEIYGSGLNVVVVVDDGSVSMNCDSADFAKLKAQFLDQIFQVQNLLDDRNLKLVVVRPNEQIIFPVSGNYMLRRIRNCVDACKSVVNVIVYGNDDITGVTEFKIQLGNALQDGDQLVGVIADGLRYIDSRHAYEVKNGFNEILEYLKELGLEGLLYRYSASQIIADGIPPERQIRKEPGKLAELLTKIAGEISPQLA